MLSELLKKKSFFLHLYEIDKKTTEQYRKKPCPFCGGNLYFANYQRKPRGELYELPEEYFIRFSLCCGNQGCRRRVIPPSCRFTGRKIYWSFIILGIVSDIQNSCPESGNFGFGRHLDISRNTLNRWCHFFKEIFPVSIQWQSIRGKVSSLVKNDDLVSSLIKHFVKVESSMTDSLIACLRFLSQGAEMEIKIRAG